MTEALILATRFAAAAIEEALARRGGAAEYRADEEVARLVEALLSPTPVGLYSRGKAANARACLASLAERAPGSPFARVLALLGADRVTRDLFTLLFAWSLDPRVGLLFGHVHDALQRTRPTLGACAEILADPVGVAIALEAASPLVRSGIAEVDRWGPDGTIGVDARVMSYAATGSLPALERPAGALSLAAALSSARPLEEAPQFPVDVLVACGRPGSGRTRAALALACHEKKSALILALRPHEGAGSLTDAALRDARLLGARLVVKGAIDDAVAEKLAGARDVPVALVLDAGAHPPAPLLARRLAICRLESRGVEERAALWAELTKREAADTEVAAVARRYAFTDGAIRRAALQVPPLSLEQAARMQLHGDLETFAFPRAGGKMTWDRLVLPDAALAALRAMCAQAKHGSKVADEWGFGRHHALGHGTKALFFGKPGTGKTLAAEILSAELDLPVARVDLSRIVSKWIGETEQNLAKVFDRARESHAILFFDEADALFSKRTAVQSSTDRYANMEVNYLLMRVEAHDGIIILATNLKANLDDAFARRLHYVVEFPEPDAVARERIWRLSVPPEAPLHADVDFALLAKRFEIPGGAIKNAVLGAAFLAVEESSPIRQRHLATALRREYGKLDRLYLKSELDVLNAAGAS
jgi:hypothetical protein